MKSRRPKRGVRARTLLRHQSWQRVQKLLHSRRPLAPDPEISFHHLALPRLPAALDGLCIAHLSDIHYGLFLSRSSLERVFALTLAQRPDLIAITGDFVTQSPAFIEPVGELMEQLEAPLGVFAVLGNHDFRAGAEPLTRALRRNGVRVLRNQHRLLRYRGTSFQIAGMDDSRQHPDLAAALGPTAERFTLLLAHNPMALTDAAALGVDLVLSGHTHGGQIKLGFAEPLYQKFLPAGFLSLAGTQMYVSRGLGKVIVPMRVGAPPELAFLTLHSSL